MTLDAVKNKPFPAGSIIVSTSATIGEHALITADFLANQRFTCLTLKKEYADKFDLKFLFYYCFKLDSYCLENLNQGNFSSVDMKKFYQFRFPIISIEEQQTIVSILDRFDKLCNSISDGLPAETEARKKQYAYYRDKLLNFENVCGGGTLDCIWRTLKDVAEITRGIRVVKSQLQFSGKYPVYQNCLTPMGYYTDKNRNANTTFIIGAGAAGEIGYSRIDFWAADDCYTFDCDNCLNSRYLFYVLQCQQKYICSKVRRASIPRISRSILEEIKIPVPPLEMQERIVSVLDRFDKLCNDISEGLPAEIEARRKQYEYYRDKLLTFKELKT